MKKCYKCEKVKRLSEFDKKGDKHQSYCKSCRKAYVDNHYQNNKEYYKSKRVLNSAIQRKKYIEYKDGLACKDCGMVFKGRPYLCDFHHPVSSKKDFNTAQLITHGFNRAMKEIKKCIPLCANCHRIRHYFKGL